MNENTAPATRAENRAANRPAKRSNKRAFVAFGLAALAIGGIGAAATSAAWTDNVFFSAQAEAATFNLQGSVDGGKTWLESADEKKIELVVPASTFANLLPEQTRTFELNVKNLGSVPAALTSSVKLVGSTFTTNPTAAVSGLVTSLASNGTDAFTLTVTAPKDWDVANQGKTATVVITVAGTATAP